MPGRLEKQTDDTSVMIAAASHLPGRPLACAVFAILLALAVPVALQAQSTAQQPTQKSEKTVRPDVRVDPTTERAGGGKSLAAKRQRLRDCGAKWQDEKKAKGLTGKTAYLKFLTACLKG
jgi:hypothetical protein